MPLSSNQIKYVKSLQLRKFRQMYGNFVVEGDKMVKEILGQPHISVEGLYALPEWLEENQKYLRGGDFPVETLSPKELGRISGLKTPNKVLAVVRRFDRTPDPARLRKSIALFLDDLQNPGNVGTILRIADWFGIPFVFASPDSAEWYNPKVIQASMGAFARVSFHTLDFDALLEQAGDMPVLGTDMSGENVFETEMPAAAILIVGNEGRGISSQMEARLHRKIAIPPHADNGSESLNAAVATGIICAVYRHRHPA
ncbi:MAG: RNA methyltransferase [Bacteroidetes bacterium]|nr:MAG: RNA methyltransferase [Bacteroidota bacterium]